MEANMPERALAYLRKYGYEFANERQLIDSCSKDLRLLWTIINTIIQPFEPEAIRSILFTESHAIGEDLQKHKFSLPFMSNLIVVAEVLKMIRVDFKLSIFLKPTVEAIPIIHNVVALAQSFEQFQQKYGEQLLDMQMLQRKFSVQKNKQQTITGQHRQLELSKQRQKPMFQAKMKQLLQLRKKLNELRQTKNKKSLVYEQLQKTKLNCNEEIRKKRQKVRKLEVDVARLKREVAENCPQIKKEKVKLEEQLEQQKLKYQQIKRVCAQKVEKTRQIIQQMGEKWMGVITGQSSMHRLKDRWINCKNKLIKNQNKINEERLNIDQLEKQDFRTDRSIAECDLKKVYLQKRREELNCSEKRLCEGEYRFRQKIERLDERLRYMQGVHLKLMEEKQRREQKIEKIVIEIDEHQRSLRQDLIQFNNYLMSNFSGVHQIFK